MNLKLIGGIILAVVLSFGAGLGLNAYNNHQKEEFKKELESSVTTIVQNALDSNFKNINAEYKDAIKKSFDQYLADKKTADDANRMLNNGQPSWVWTVQPDQKPSSDAKAGTATAGSKSTVTVRTQLSEQTSVPLKREALRADQCAIDYNKLKSDYDALWWSVYRYNQSVDQYNGMLKK